MAASQTHVNEDLVTLNTSVEVRIEYLVYVTLNESDRRGNGRMPNYSPLLAMALCCPTNNWHKLFLLKTDVFTLKNVQTTARTSSSSCPTNWLCLDAVRFHDVFT
jgi:hypothetical protein